MSLESGKKFGFIGSIITVLMPIISVILAIVLIFAPLFSSPPARPAPFVSSIAWIIVFAALGFMSLIGFILFLVGMRNLSQYYGDYGIFRNTLYGFVLYIIGTAVAVGIEIAFFTYTIGSIFQVSPSTPPTNFILGLFSAFFAVFAVILVFSIVSAVFYMRAFNLLGERSGIENFKTAGLLYLIGTALAIVIVGGFLVWIAWILAALGFNSLKPVSAIYRPSVSQPIQPSMTQRKYCPYCGTENNVDASYCRHCGRQLK